MTKVTTAMSALYYFLCSKADGWTDIQDRLDSRNMTYSRVYTIVFICMGHFIFSNVFIGVIIMNISGSTEAFKVSFQLITILCYPRNIGNQFGHLGKIQRIYLKSILYYSRMHL